jgi:3-oxoacyl-(acyl-carrier-protein) synthase
LYSGPEEECYGLRATEGGKRVLGEGAAYVVLERLEDAIARGAQPWLEVLGFSMATEPQGFYEARRDTAPLYRAIEQALGEARVSPRELGAVLWSPQGNASDERMRGAIELAIGQHGSSVPLVTSVFQTGLLEASSGVVNLCAVLAALRSDLPLWSVEGGLPNVEPQRRAVARAPLLVVAGSDIGFYLAMVLRPFEGVA